MSSVLERVFEHNNWANQELIRACAGLLDKQLDARPHAATQRSIRETLVHLVRAQSGYLSLLTLPPEERSSPEPAFAQLEDAAATSGAALLALVRTGETDDVAALVRTLDGYVVDPWVVLLQAVNHANDHRKQVTGIMHALGLLPPQLDGWGFGEVTGALMPIRP